jgi:predicted Zn-dependent protease
MRRAQNANFPIAALLLGLVGCTINPVTGQRQLALVSADDEIAIGNQQYLPSQQMQGGEYLGDPALTRYVRDVGNRLAQVSDRALPYEFVIINSSVPNAWALPGGKIGINRGLLLELDSEAELAAVLGHEIVHAAARHGALAMQRGLLLQGALAVAAVAARNRDYSELAVGAAGVGAQLIHMRHGRGDELEADAYGMEYMSRAGYDPQAAISLQETFVRLAAGRDNGGWLAGLFASHPPSMERVEQNRLTAQRLTARGTIGREPYAAATAQLRRNAAGFEALDDAREALAADDLAAARRDANRAAELLADSADAEAMLGDIELAAGAPAAALGHYQTAIGRNPRFFKTHLGAGSAHRRLGQLSQAESEYRASIDLLPTADAYLGLGRVAEARNDVEGALEHYARAAESAGAAGAEARAAIVRLDLPRNPEVYLSLTAGLDSNGRLVVEIANATDVAVGSIGLQLRYLEGGQVRQTQRTLTEALGPGARRRYATGLGPFTSASDYSVSIETATIAPAP